MNGDVQQPSVAVKTIDGEELERDKARSMSRRMYVMGYALLPWMWVMNVWLFWPELRQGGDPAIQSYVKKSALGALIMFLVLVPWMLAYCIGQEAIFGERMFHKLDASRLKLTTELRDKTSQLHTQPCISVVDGSSIKTLNLGRTRSGARYKVLGSPSSTPRQKSKALILTLSLRGLHPVVAPKEDVQTTLLSFLDTFSMQRCPPE